jgi:hypothetical protein
VCERVANDSKSDSFDSKIDQHPNTFAHGNRDGSQIPAGMGSEIASTDDGNSAAEQYKIGYTIRPITYGKNG